MPYTDPIVWAAGDLATQEKLNAIQENIRSLKIPAFAHTTIRGTGTNITTTSTTNTAVDDAQFTLTVATTGFGPVRLELNAMFGHSVAAGQIALDVLIDDTNFVSSMTATPVTNGLWYPRVATAVGYPFAATHIIPNGLLTAGVHTFKLRWRVVTAGTATLFLNHLMQFSVSE